MPISAGMLKTGSKINELKRVDMKIVNRIINVMGNSNLEKKTTIALKSHLSYDKCIRYLDWLEKMELISKEQNGNKFQKIKLTQKGYRIYSDNIQI